jgi:hypothetical protein
MPFYAVMKKDPGRMFGWDDGIKQNRFSAQDAGVKIRSAKNRERMGLIL